MQRVCTNKRKSASCAICICAEKGARQKVAMMDAFFRIARSPHWSAMISDLHTRRGSCQSGNLHGPDARACITRRAPRDVIAERKLNE